MIPIAEFLPPEHVHLDLPALKLARAIERIAEPLRRHPAVLDWERLVKGLCGAAPCVAPDGADFVIAIPHARTDAVSEMVMCVGRSEAGIRAPGDAPAVRYVFCFGVPAAMAQDYLRIVGLLTRLMKEEGAEQELRTAASAEEFIATLARLEARL